MPANKSLVILVGVLGAAILTALGILAFGLIQQAKDPSFKFFKEAPASTPATVSTNKAAHTDQAPSKNQVPRQFGDIQVALPAGSRVIDFQVDGNRLIVRLEIGAGDTRRTQLLYLDATTGQPMGRVNLTPDQ